MTKSELLGYEPGVIRSDPRLYRVFQNLYKEEYGGGCSSCSFNSTIARWKQELNNFNTNTNIMSNKRNSFVLAQFHDLVWVPGTNKVIKKDSPDEWAIEFLTQENSKHFEARKKTFFQKLPDGIDHNGNLVKTEKSKSDSFKLKSSITRAKNSLIKKVDKMSLKDADNVKSEIESKFSKFGELDLQDCKAHYEEAISEVRACYAKKLNQLEKGKQKE